MGIIDILRQLKIPRTEIIYLTTFLTPTLLFLYFLDNLTFKFKNTLEYVDTGFPAIHANFHRNRTTNL